MSNNVSVTLSGPIFDGDATLELDAIHWAIDDALGAAGVQLVQGQLDDNLRHPTGWYRSNVRYERDESGGGVVTDGGVIYGPWLEGTSRRNETTRFKGYSSFRKAAQQLEDKAVDIAEAAAAKVIERLNG